jgi:PhnB protein
MKNWKPKEYTSVSPYLICRDAEQTMEFIKQVLDGVELQRFARPDGSLMHAELRIDDSVVMIGGAQSDRSGGEPHIHVYVADVDAVYARALDFGAEPVQEPVRKSADDDKRGGVRDACGNTWWIATQ